MHHEQNTGYGGNSFFGFNPYMMDMYRSAIISNLGEMNQSMHQGVGNYVTPYSYPYKPEGDVNVDTVEAAGSTTDPNQVLGAITSGIGFTQSIAGYDATLNPADYEVRNEQSIDVDNPYLSSKTFNQNMAEASTKGVKSSNARNAIGTIGSAAALGASIGSFVPGGTFIGAGIGAGVGALTSVAGGVIRRGKARRARRAAIKKRKANIDKYNMATASYYENEAVQDKINNMAPSYTRRLSSLI